MVVEFLEAVTRLGVLKYQDAESNQVQEDSLSYYECIKLAVEDLTNWSQTLA